jgi:hypothetical protein
VSVVGTVFLLAVDWDLGAVHVSHDSLRRIDGLRLCDELPVDLCQTRKVFVLCQQFCLE